jgi:hypothetical protein
LGGPQSHSGNGGEEKIPRIMVVVVVVMIVTK